ncbi:MAG: ATP synthase F1 subunit delta [Hydrogenibacillus sp.]|nr:ATP synthase F1 subunit delta [Hydrogenibacillus sp.]
MSRRNLRLSRRYARALFRALSDGASRRAARERLSALVEWIAKTKEAEALLRHPLVKAEDKLALLKTALGDADPRLVAFVELLVDRGRVEALPEVYQAFSDEVLKGEGVVHIDVRAARPLDDRLRDRIRRAFLARGYKTVELTETVDPSLIGGFVLKAGDLWIDSSMRNALHRLREKLAAGVESRSEGGA